MANPKRWPDDHLRHEGEPPDEGRDRMRHRTAQLNRVIAWCWVAAFVLVAIGIVVGRY